MSIFVYRALTPAVHAAREIEEARTAKTRTIEFTSVEGLRTLRLTFKKPPGDLWSVEVESQEARVVDLKAPRTPVSADDITHVTNTTCEGYLLRRLRAQGALPEIIHRLQSAPGPKPQQCKPLHSTAVDLIEDLARHLGMFLPAVRCGHGEQAPAIGRRTP